MKAIHHNQVLLATFVMLMTVMDTSGGSTVEIRTHGWAMGGTSSDIDMRLYVKRRSNSHTYITCDFPCQRSDYCQRYTKQTVDCPDLNGILWRVTLIHRGGGMSPNWAVDWVKVRENGYSYLLDFERWIDPDQNIAKDIPDAPCSLPRTPINGQISGVISGVIQHNSYGEFKCNDGNPGYYLAPGSDTNFFCWGSYLEPKSPTASCTVCPSITHCKIYNHCTGSSDSRCTTCRYDRGDEKAYEVSNRGTSCKQLCSWRLDSKFCYPGRCTDNTPSSCTCAPRFSGNNCLTIDTPPVMHNCLGKLKKIVSGKESDTVDAPCTNSTTAPSTVWTNIKLNLTAQIQFEANWTTSFHGPNATDWPRHYYIEDHRLGVISASVDWWLDQGGITMSNGIIPCEDNRISEDNPTSSMHDCTKTEVIPVTPQHGDSLYFTTKSTNGGYVKVRNYDGESGYTVNPPVYFSGREVAHTASFTFDLEPPYHCSVSGGCTDSMLDRGPAITKDGHINLRWSGWRDDGAGIAEYEYEVFLLVFVCFVCLF
ncbi:uncharacterized protein [Branchiostoma lanceolatum]|uniref:uncharacterized protein n=1 Tax=Branchiostoma lanceolatum TaxID=7740 RepID=UPI0034556752